MNEFIKQLEKKQQGLSTASIRRNAVRQQVRLQRQQLTQQQQSDAEINLLARFTSDEKILSAKSIALYLSNDSEINTQLLIAWCWQQGKAVYLPVVHPFSAGHLIFLRYKPQTTLVSNSYGIGEPKLDVRHIISLKQLDVICTPLVAFDKKGARLGMGGGFYDRTLSHWYQQYQTQKNTRPYPIGFAHDCQLVDSLPTEQWDIPLPEVITPTTHYKFN